MSYQVLARKLRPPRFDALVGQEHVVRALSHALDTGRLHHAYLFTGTRGVGKTTIARILAKCLNCETGVTSKPCCECSACREIAEGRFIDLIEVDAASRAKVDDTRDLLDNVQYLPARGRFKVYLIDEVHMLSPASFNALLKTLEEPPEHVKFLLATTDPRKVPLTVLSRCLQFQLKNLLPERIGSYLTLVLEREGIEFDAESVELIARAGRGSMRDALSILDQAISFGGGRLQAADVGDMLGSIERQDVEPILDALSRGDAEAVLHVCDTFAARGTDFREVLNAVLSACHEIAVSQLVPLQRHSILGDRFAAVLDPETVQLYYQIVLTGLRDFSLAPDPRVAFEMTMLRALAFVRAAPEAPPAGTMTPSEAPEPPTVAPEGRDSTARSPAGRTRSAAGPSAGARKANDPDSDEWFAVTCALELKGVARMLAEHSVLLERQGDMWSLCLDSDHDTLLAEGPRRAVERALSQHVGRDVRVTIEPGQPASETPARRKAREEQERHVLAVAALHADDNVRSLLEEFGAELRLDTVKPITRS